MQQKNDKNKISELTRNIMLTKGTKTVRLRIPIFNEIKRLAKQKKIVFTEYINKIMLDVVIKEIEEERKSKANQ